MSAKFPRGGAGPFLPRSLSNRTILVLIKNKICTDVSRKNTKRTDGLMDRWFDGTDDNIPDFFFKTCRYNQT